MKIFRKIYNHILSSKKSISKEDQWREYSGSVVKTKI